MKKIIVIVLTVFVTLLGAAGVYVYALGGVLPFGIVFPGQPDFPGEQTGLSEIKELSSLASAVTELFSSPIIIKNGEITSLDDTIPLLSASSGLYTFAPYFPAKDYKIAGFDCGRPMTLYFDFDQNYYCVIRPVNDIVYQILSKGPPYFHTAGPENGSMTAELLIAQDIYGYRFAFVNKERVNETKSAVINRDALIQVMTDIYSETASELAISKNLYETVTGGLTFKKLVHLDYGFTVNADIRSYDPGDKRITLSPKGGLCVTDITVSKRTATSKNLLKRVGPIGSDSYFLAYRQPLSGNVVIALPDGDSYLYVSISGAGEVGDTALYNYLLTILTVDYAGVLALADGSDK